MGTITDNLSIVKSRADIVPVPAHNGANTPHVEDRDIFVSMTLIATFSTIVLQDAVVRLQVRDEGGGWQTIDECSMVGGSVKVLTTTVSVLGARVGRLHGYVKSGQEYRYTGVNLGLNTTIVCSSCYETALEVDLHDSVQIRVDGTDPQSAPPTDALRLPCDWPCWTPELFIDTYKRDPSEGLRVFDNGKAYVRGVDPGGLTVAGRKADEQDDSFVLNWRGVDYTALDPEITFPTPTSWEFVGPAGDEVSPPGEVLTINQTGQPVQSVEICVDRTGPNAAIDLSALTVGADAGAPLYRGEYIRFTPTFSDAATGLDGASVTYSVPSDWVNPPSSLTSGQATAWFRSSASAPTAGTRTITLTVTDKAGNQTQAVATIHFGALPALSLVTLQNLTGVERPAHLSADEWAQTAYDDRAVGATIAIDPVLAACRNSGNDDTFSKLISGSLSIVQDQVNDVAGAAAIVHDTIVNDQPSGLGLTIAGQIRDQHYRSPVSANAGDYAFNENRADDFGIDQTVGVGEPPYTGRAAEVLTDELSGLVLANATIVGGAVSWSAAGTGELTLLLPDNVGQLYRPRFFDPLGNELLHGTWGDDLQVELHDGANWVSPAGDDFGPQSEFNIPNKLAVASIDLRLTVSDPGLPSIGAIVMNYQRG